MNDGTPTIRELLTHPDVQELVSQADMERITQSLAESEESEEESKDPIYIRIFAGTGAWFSALFLIFFFGVSIEIFRSSIGAIICGIALLAGAICITRRSKGTFLSQLSLVLAFSGNALVLVGLATGIHHFSIALVIAHAIICAVVYPLYPNSIYRFLAPIALATLATAWIVDSEVFALIHVLIAAETLLIGILFFNKKHLILLKPLVYSSAIMLPATLLFMNLIQTTGWKRDFGISLWPSSILLAAGLIYLYFHLAGNWRRIGESWLLLAVLSTIMLSIFTTPGILVAIGLLVMGYALGDHILTTLSYLFLVCFLVVFYYSLNIDLAHKSWVVAGSGVALLVVRWIAGYYRPKETTT